MLRMLPHRSLLYSLPGIAAASTPRNEQKPMPVTLVWKICLILLWSAVEGISIYHYMLSQPFCLGKRSTYFEITQNHMPIYNLRVFCQVMNSGLMQKRLLSSDVLPTIQLTYLECSWCFGFFSCVYVCSYVHAHVCAGTHKGQGLLRTRVTGSCEPPDVGDCKWTLSSAKRYALFFEIGFLHVALAVLELTL